MKRGIALFPQRCSQIHDSMHLWVIQIALNSCCDPYCSLMGYSRHHQKAEVKNETKFKKWMQCLYV